jgi:hypothetical protein
VTTPFPFIVGCGRSGTTLLRVMLDSHSELVIPPETMFIAGMAKQRAAYGKDGAFNSGRFEADLIGGGWLWRWRTSDKEEVRVSLAERPPSSLADATRQVFLSQAKKQGKSRYGAKTPDYVLHMPLISEVLPEARFIHVVRDGRDVALSVIEANWGPDSTPGAATWWERRVREGREAGIALGGNRYQEVRYEDLVADPEGILREICRFIELDYEPEMLSYHRREGVGDDAGRPEQHRNLRRPPTRGLRDWRREMAAGDVEVFEALAGHLLTELGYERAFPRPSPAAMRAARRHRRRARLWRILGEGRRRTGRALRRVGVRRVRERPEAGAPREAEVG